MRNAATAEATAQYKVTHNPFTVPQRLQPAHRQGEGLESDRRCTSQSQTVTQLDCGFVCCIRVSLALFLCCAAAVFVVSMVIQYGYGYGGDRGYLRDRSASLNLLSLVASQFPL